MKKIYIALAAIMLMGVIACSGDESNKKDITAYSLAGVVGTINEEEKTIAVEVPYNTDVTAQIATFTTKGSRVTVGATEQISGTTVNNFTSQLIYTVKAEDGSTVDYTVTVTLAPSPEKAITAYSLAGVVGRINEEKKTIAVAMPFDADVTTMIATFTTTGSRVTVGATTQISGTTANNFKSPLIYTVTAEDGSSVDYTVTVGIAITTWQSYCGSEPGRIHYWRGTTGVLTIERLPLVSSTSHSLYGFTNNGNLIAVNRSLSKQWRFNAEEDSFVSTSYVAFPPFVTATHSFQQELSQVAACPITGGECKIITTYSGSIPFVFAEHNKHVLAVTNYDDVLIFDGTNWCRASRSGDIYRCDPNANEPMVTEHRGIQFYSSINYMGKTFVGEYPTGRLYEFDGETLRPADMLQPPFVTGEAHGYEAQSVAEYCGDLFVGYWPWGEIWRRDRSTGEWSMVARLFSHPAVTERLCPYKDQQEDGLPGCFYGQRITTLVPFGDSLYAFTSNLGGWREDFESSILTKDEVAEYGAVYRLTIPGCQTIEP